MRGADNQTLKNMFLRASWLLTHTSSGVCITWEDAVENQAEISSSGLFTETSSQQKQSSGR